MKAPDRTKNRALAEAWDLYGHEVAWEDLVDMKHSTHGYVALAWKERDGNINYADLALVDGTWEWLNDCHVSIPEWLWKKARSKPECDCLEFPVKGKLWTTDSDEALESHDE